MLKVDHCLEEQRRLGQEADNLCRWFGRELLALEAAVLSPFSESVRLTFNARQIMLYQTNPFRSFWRAGVLIFSRSNADGPTSLHLVFALKVTYKLQSS